jgi:hypothetical protein
LVTAGGIFVAGDTSPGSLYLFFPFLPPQSVGPPIRNNLGNFPQDITTDGSSIWTSNAGGLVPGSGSVSKVTNIVTNITAGFSQPVGILFDGANVWVTDFGDNKLKKLDSNGNVLQSIDVGTGPQHPVFDGANIWVPNFTDNSVTVVRTRDGMVLATLTGNGLSSPHQIAFDGQRILVTNSGGAGGVSLWNATTLAPIGSATVSLGIQPVGACSDGINFWVTGNNELWKL